MRAEPFARGSRAWGECARSGQRLLLKDMVEDPLTGLLVAPDWAEPPLMRPPTDLIDGVALERPAPDLDHYGVDIYIQNCYDLKADSPPRPLTMFFELGTATVMVT